MTFFNEKKLKPRRIEIDKNAVSSGSPQMTQRLDRIHENYQRLDVILDEVEMKIRTDERLSAIDQSITEVEVAEKKKRWRPRKTTKRKSKNPKKPR